MKAYYEARAREHDDWWLGRELYADRLGGRVLRQNECFVTVAAP